METTYSGIPNSLCQQLVELSEIHFPRKNKLLLRICTRTLTEVNCTEIHEKFNLIHVTAHSSLQHLL